MLFRSAQPLPIAPSLIAEVLAASRRSPKRAGWAAACAAWALLLLRALLRLLVLLPATWRGAPAADADGATWRLLSAHFVGCAALGHHLLCRYHLRAPLRARPRAALQSLILQTAALQLVAAGVPVAAHVVGLVPAPAAAAATALPLTTAAPHAAAYCAVFIGGNAAAALALARRRWREQQAWRRERGPPSPCKKDQ